MQRNRFVDDEIPELSGYYGMTAQRAYEKRRAIHRKLVRHPAMKSAVVDRLKQSCMHPPHIPRRMHSHPSRDAFTAQVVYCLKKSINQLFLRRMLEGKLDEVLGRTVIIVDEVDDLVVNENPNANYVKEDVERTPDLRKCVAARLIAPGSHPDCTLIVY